MSSSGDFYKMLYFIMRAEKKKETLEKYQKEKKAAWEHQKMNMRIKKG